MNPPFPDRGAQLAARIIEAFITQGGAILYTPPPNAKDTRPRMVFAAGQCTPHDAAVVCGRLAAQANLLNDTLLEMFGTDEKEWFRVKAGAELDCEVDLENENIEARAIWPVKDDTL